MATAPKVVLSEGKRVRLRGNNHALTGCLCIEENGKPVELKYTLEPNRWTKVHPIVYAFLKGKFDEPREVEVPDWEPGGDESRAVRTPRIESQQQYIIEFGG